MENYNQNIIKHKTGLLKLVEELGNNSKACRIIVFLEILFISIRRQKKAAALKPYFTQTEENRILRTGLMRIWKKQLLILLLNFWYTDKSEYVTG